MKFLPVFLSFFALSRAIAPPSELTAPEPIPDISRHRFTTQFFSTLHVPRLVMYVQTFTTKDNKPLSLLPLLEQQTGVTNIILASVHLHEIPGEIRLNDDPFDAAKFDEVWKEVKILQEAGVKVSMLLGGAAKGTYRNLNGTDDEFYAFYHPLLKLIRKYSLDGLDIDIEEDVPISVPLRLLNALYRDLGPSFLLTMTPLSSALLPPASDPQNLSGFSYFELDQLATVPGKEDKLVKWYNAMFYGHFAHGPPHYDSVIDAGWDPDRVVMGVLDCADDGQPNGFVRIEKLRETVRDLRDKFDGFGGVAGWEYYDAGWSDGKDSGDVKPWEWVMQIGDSLFGGLGSNSEL